MPPHPDHSAAPAHAQAQPANSPDPAMLAACLETYAAFQAAEPPLRTTLFLELLGAQPNNRLELPALGTHHATLDGINLSPQHLRTLIPEGQRTPTWWHKERQAIDLRHADLRGASLRHADLHSAVLEEADLTTADLAGANLQGADLSGATLQRALFEDADLRKAVLRFAQCQGSVWEDAKLQGADFWGANLEGADLSGADLQGATLEEGNFRGADLTGADLRGAVLRRADFTGAKLHGADLRGAALGGSNFENASLRHAQVQELDLTACALAHVHTSNTRFDRTHLDREQIGSIGEELAGEFGLARKGYLALERNFDELGDHDGARWAYLRRRRMEKRQASHDARAAWNEGQWARATHFSLKYAGDQIVEWVCDYGESVLRVLGTLLVVYLFFIPVYGLTGSVSRIVKTPDGQLVVPTHDFLDMALFSLTAMTSAGNPPEYLRHQHELAYLLSGAQMLLSLFLTGLMGFVAGNRIRR